MKKVIILILSLLLCIGIFVSCDKAEAPSSSESQSESSSSATEQEREEEIASSENVNTSPPAKAKSELATPSAPLSKWNKVKITEPSPNEEFSYTPLYSASFRCYTARDEMGNSYLQYGIEDTTYTVRFSHSADYVPLSDSEIVKLLDHAGFVTLESFTFVTTFKFNSFSSFYSIQSALLNHLNLREEVDSISVSYSSSIEYEPNQALSWYDFTCIDSIGVSKLISSYTQSPDTESSFSSEFFEKNVLLMLDAELCPTHTIFTNAMYVSDGADEKKLYITALNNDCDCMEINHVTALILIPRTEFVFESVPESTQEIQIEILHRNANYSGDEHFYLAKKWEEKVSFKSDSSTSLGNSMITALNSKGYKIVDYGCFDSIFTITIRFTSEGAKARMLELYEASGNFPYHRSIDTSPDKSVIIYYSGFESFKQEQERVIESFIPCCQVESMEIGEISFKDEIDSSLLYESESVYSDKIFNFDSLLMTTYNGYQHFEALHGDAFKNLSERFKQKLSADFFEQNALFVFQREINPDLFGDYYYCDAQRKSETDCFYITRVRGLYHFMETPDYVLENGVYIDFVIVPKINILSDNMELEDRYPVTGDMVTVEKYVTHNAEYKETLDDAIEDAENQ